MTRTAWSRASSVPSDRLPPTNPSQPNRNKGNGKSNGPPKSKEVLRLEGLVEGLRAPSNSKDPKGGCFCQARVHSLSKYTPICTHCGLVLCSLHGPYYSCPHCAASILSKSSRDTLIEELTLEISDVVARELEQREREEQERKKAAGAFPTLSIPGGIPQASIPSQPRKVLSLNAQTKKVTVSSYKPIPPASHAPSKPEEFEPAETRVLPPPKSVDFVRGKGTEGGRWENLRNERIYYAPPPTQHAEGSGRGRRKKKKGPESNQS